MIADPAQTGSPVPNGYANGGARIVDVPEELRGRLHPNHYADLAKSGLTVQTIADADLHSEARYPALASTVQWDSWPKRMGAALVFPYVDRDGKEVFARLKPDRPRVAGAKRKVCKYEQPKGVSPRPYITRRVWKAIDSPDAELFIGEGEKKALAATQAGFPTIGLAGVFSWMDPKRAKLVPDLAAINWKSRRVFIVFDSDTKPEAVANVRDAELRLAAALKAAGAIVKVVRLPLDDQSKMGLDDFLVAKGENGPAELRKLLDAAPDPDEPDAGVTRPHAKELDPACEARAFLEKHSTDGLSRIRFYRGSWWVWRNGKYAAQPESEIQSRVIRFLDESWVGLTRSRIGDVMTMVKAFATLSSTIEAPAWIADGPDWKPENCLATPRAIHHIPSLTTGAPEQIAATPRFFTTNAIDYELRLDAPEPVAWLKFIDDAWPDDPESAELLQEFFGLCLTADTSFQKFLCMIGPQRCGKGTILRVLTALVGAGNVASPTLSSLGERFGLSPLVGKSVAAIADARLTGRADQAPIVERLLSITGEDLLNVDVKFAEATMRKIQARIVLVSNELPRLTDSSGALAGRMLLLQMRRSFYGREDRGLTARLLTELPGILLWAIGGWARLQQRGRFAQPASAQDLLQDMRDLASPIAAFVSDRCVVGPDLFVAKQDLFNAWRDWCELQGNNAVGSAANFTRLLVAAHPEISGSRPRVGGPNSRTGTNRPRCYIGITLRSGDPND